MMIVVLTQRFVVSGGPSIPPALARASLRRLPQSTLAAIGQARRRFDMTPAGTTIRSGHSTIAEPAPELEIVDGTTVIHGWEPAAEEHGRACRTQSSLRITGLRLADAGDMASLSGRWEATTAAGTALTRAFTMALRRFPNGEWKIVREVFPSPPVTAVGAVPPRVESRRERLFAGAAALVFPRVLGERLGFFDVVGGRGLLWFAEIDGRCDLFAAVKAP
jgi:hypothetical protein